MPVVSFARVGGVSSGTGSTVGTARNLGYALQQTDWDELRVIDDGTPFEIVPSGASGNQMNQILTSFGVGTYPEPKRIVGCNTSGEINGARFRTLAVGFGSTDITALVFHGNHGHIVLENGIIDGGSTSSSTGSYNCCNNSGNTGTGTGTNSTTTGLLIECRNMRFTRARHNGLSLFGGPAATAVPFGIRLFDCEFDNNGLAGGTGMIIRGNSGSVYAERCVFRNNNTNGLTANTGTIVNPLAFVDCVFAANTGGLQPTTGGSCLIRGCVFDGNTGTGLALPSTADRDYLAEGCVFSNNTLGVNLIAYTTATPNLAPMQACCFWGNTIDATDDSANPITPPGRGHVYVDPGYVNRAAGDYRINPTGPLGRLRSQATLAAFGTRPLSAGIGIEPQRPIAFRGRR